MEAQTSPAPENLPDPGVPAEIEPVINAVLSGDIEAKQALIQFTTTACTNAEGLSGLPKCPPGEEEGATVDVFPVSSGEGMFVRLEDIDKTLDFTVQ